MPTPTPPTPMSFRKAPSISNPHSQFLYAASGPVSGTEFFCSAMHIQSQQLQVQYKRVPQGVFNMFGGTGSTNQDFNLSSIVVSGAIGRTFFSMEVVAVAQGEIVSGMCWESSGFSQDQSFLIDSQSSLDGVTYGTVADGTFGPAGVVYNPTSGTFYRRTPIPPVFDPDDYDVYTEYRVGYNYAIIDVSGPARCQGPTYPNVQVGSPPKTAYDFFAIQSMIGQDPTVEGLCGQRITEITGTFQSQKVGGYATSQDDVQDVPSVVDLVGWGIRLPQPGMSFVSGDNIQLLAAPHYNPWNHTW